MFDQRMLNREPSDTVGRSSRYRLTILRPSSIQAFSLASSPAASISASQRRAISAWSGFFLPLPLHGHRHALAIIGSRGHERHGHRSGHGQRPICSQRKPIYPGHHSTSGIDHNPAFCIVFDRRHILDTLLLILSDSLHSSSMVTPVRIRFPSCRTGNLALSSFGGSLKSCIT